MVWLESNGRGSRFQYGVCIACDVLAIGQLRRICPFAHSSQHAPNRVQLGIENGKATFEAGTQNPAVYSLLVQHNAASSDRQRVPQRQHVHQSATGEPYFHLPARSLRLSGEGQTSVPEVCSQRGSSAWLGLYFGCHVTERGVMRWPTNRATSPKAGVRCYPSDRRTR